MAAVMVDRNAPSVQPVVDVMVFTKRSGSGGVERIAERLIAAWRGAGVGVAHVIAPAGRRVPEWVELLHLVRETARLVRESPPRLVFCPGNAYGVVAVLLKLLLGRRCPPVVAKISNDLHRVDMVPPLRPFYRWWLRVQGAVIDEFAALSPAMAEEIVERMGVLAQRVHVVPNPVLSLADTARRVTPQAPEDGRGRRFVAVGRLEPQKDLTLMVRAFARGSVARDTLTVWGEGRERVRLERLAATLGIARRVCFAGRCGAMRDELARHDILLLSSRYEGQPGAVVEALSVGLDVIATRCSVGMADLLDNGALGRLVPPCDEAAFAHAIATARVGAQDRARAQAKAQEFTIEAALPAYAALFATACARATGPRRSPRPPHGARVAAA